MQVFIQQNGGEFVEAEAGTRIILDLGAFKTLELVVDEQDFQGDTARFVIKSGGKPYARLINDTSLIVGIRDLPADPHAIPVSPPVAP